MIGINAGGLGGAILDMLATLSLRSFLKSLGCETTCTEMDVPQIAVALIIFIALATILFMYFRKNKNGKSKKSRRRGHS